MQLEKHPCCLCEFLHKEKNKSYSGYFRFKHSRRQTRLCEKSWRYTSWHNLLCIFQPPVAGENARGRKAAEITSCKVSVLDRIFGFPPANNIHWSCIHCVQQRKLYPAPRGRLGLGLDENYLKSKAGILKLLNTQAPSGPLKCFTERGRRDGGAKWSFMGTI